MDKNQAFAYSLSYTTDLTLREVDEYKDILSQHGAPSMTKAGIVADVCHALPVINDNWFGFTEQTLRNSYRTYTSSYIDYGHVHEEILGYVAKAELVEETPLTLRIIGVLWKKRLDDYWVTDLEGLKWSIECLYNNYCFWTKNKGLIPPDKAPLEWIENKIQWEEGVPVYDENGDRVALILGGENGEIEFHGLAITWNPADPEVKTQLKVASKKGGNNGMQYTKEQLDEAVANAKSEMQKSMDELRHKLNEATASAETKRSEADELQVKVNQLETKISELEGEIKERELIERLESRMSLISAKNIPIRDEKKDWIKSAEDDVFNDWMADMEAVLLSVKSSTATASAYGDGSVGVSLTRKSDDSVQNRNPHL